MTKADDKADIGELIRAFALAADRAVPREMAALMCADEAEAFLDNVADPDIGEPDEFDTEPVDTLTVRVYGDVALARITRPSFTGDNTLVCRREGGRWTVCADAEDELSLEQLEDDVRTTRGDASAEQRRVHELRRRPIGKLTVEDIRQLLLSDDGLDHLLPRAACKLEWQPLLTGDSHPGDLLFAVLGVDKTRWAKDPVALFRVRTAVRKLREMGDLDPHEMPDDALWSRIALFEAEHPQ